jgi:hypothetical protein
MQAVCGHTGLCRKIAFSGQNPKIVYWKIKDLRVQTFLFSVICDRTLMLPGSTTTHENRIYKAALTGYLVYPEGLPVQMNPLSIPSDSFHGAHMDITTDQRGVLRGSRPLHATRAMAHARGSHPVHAHTKGTQARIWELWKRTITAANRSTGRVHARGEKYVHCGQSCSSRSALA